MVTYTTTICEGDFKKIYPEIDLKGYTKPIAVAIHNNYDEGKGYGAVYADATLPYLIFSNVQHIYCPRRYFEIVRENEKILKVRKEDTKHIYFIVED